LASTYTSVFSPPKLALGHAAETSASRVTSSATAASLASLDPRSVRSEKFGVSTFRHVPLEEHATVNKAMKGNEGFTRPV